MFDLITRDFDDMVHDVFDGFGGFFGPRGDMRPYRGFRMPARQMMTEVSETEDAFIIKAGVPGFKKEDFHVTVDGDVLSIVAEKKAEDRKEEEGKLVKSTYNYSRAESRFRLPDVGKEDISAKYEDGELKITIKKKEKKLPEENTIDIE